MSPNHTVYFVENNLLLQRRHVFLALSGYTVHRFLLIIDLIIQVNLDLY